MNKERLLQLAEHLEKGKLGHKYFDFAVINEISMERGRFKKNGCGTMGCAMGEMPIIWPESFEFKARQLCADPSHIHCKESGLLDDVAAQRWFDLTDDEVEHLFYPDRQRPDMFGGEYLNNEATKEDVAHNIREFIATKERDESHELISKQEEKENA